MKHDDVIVLVSMLAFMGVVIGAALVFSDPDAAIAGVVLVLSAGAMATIVVIANKYHDEAA